MIVMILACIMCSAGKVAPRCMSQAITGRPIEISKLWNKKPEVKEFYNWPVEIDVQRLVKDLGLDSPTEEEMIILSNGGIKKAKPWETRKTVEHSVPFGTKIGKVVCEKIGVEQDVYWDINQWWVDNPNTMCIWGYSGLPGEEDLGVCLYDHNYQTGKLFAQCVLGDIVRIETDWGTYEYQYISSEMGETVNSTKVIPQKIKRRIGVFFDTFVGEIVTPKYPMGLVYSCCTPEDGHNGELIIVTCYPLDKKITKERLVMTFECISGPKLIM